MIWSWAFLDSDLRQALFAASAATLHHVRRTANVVAHLLVLIVLGFCFILQPFLLWRMLYPMIVMLNH